MAWLKTDFSGVQYQAHETRKHGIKFDHYFRGRYQVGGKRVMIGFGWTSEGWTAKKVYYKIQEYRQNAKTGQGPTTLKEEKSLNEHKKALEKAETDRQALVNISFGQFFEETYLPQAQAPGGKKKDSWRKEKSHFSKWINPIIGNKPLNEITPSDIEKVKSAMFKAGLADRSVQYCLATIRQVFNKAMFMDLFKNENPINKVKIPSPNNKRIRFLSREEVQALFQELKKRSQNLYDIALLSLQTGMRAGEIFSLTWSSLDLEQGIIHIRDAKGNKDRTAYMTEEVKEMFQGREQNNNLVFPSRTGKKRQGISKVFYKAVKDSGLNNNISNDKDKACFHTLRHTFASWQVQDGMPLFTLQKLLGHSTIAMTERYSHLAPENMKQATKIFDNARKKGKVIQLKSA